jgi:hypothetical protein
MTPSSDTAALRSRARGAYERSRLGLGVRAALPVLPMAALSLLVCERPALTLACGGLLFVLAVALRARGGSYGRALVPGLLAGSAPLILPLVLRASGHCCIGGACWSLCMLGCTLGGLVAGVAIGVAAAMERDQRGAFLLSATLVAGLAGVLGCAMAGASGIAGMALAIAGASIPTAIAARARA